MTTIITINIGGTIRMVDEEAYAALRRYLDQARAQLGSNPDAPEIVADLERSIGEKLSRQAEGGVPAATKSDVLAILEEIGPVDPDVAHATAPSMPPSAGRRLYRIHEGELIGGVCTGLAAYADLDVTLVRLLFVVLTILTGGVLALAYLVMMFVVPVAPTVAAARAPAAVRT
jgi:phage shock protein PspC (stress-responsive transcriptional regulator)